LKVVNSALYSLHRLGATFSYIELKTGCFFSQFYPEHVLFNIFHKLRVIFRLSFAFYLTQLTLSDMS